MLPGIRAGVAGPGLGRGPRYPTRRRGAGGSGPGSEGAAGGGALGLGRRAGSASAAGAASLGPGAAGEGGELEAESVDVALSPSRAGAARPAPVRPPLAGPTLPTVSASWLRATRTPPGFGEGGVWAPVRGAAAPGAAGLRSRGRPGGCILQTKDGTAQ